MTEMIAEVRVQLRGIAALTTLQETGVYEKLEALGDLLASGLLTAAEETNTPIEVNRVGSMLTAFFRHGHVASYTDARLADTDAYSRFFRGMLQRGIYLAPSQFEAMFVSLAHTKKDIRATVEAARAALIET